mgnify:CR=1 FL=1|tara:strand:- start:314 stop:1285 length:972 start_codon:yes stop_codon:yes gene_type:complete
MEKVKVSELEEMIRSKFLEKGASEEEIKEEVVKAISEKIKNKSKEGKDEVQDVEQNDVLDVDISKPQDVEGKIPSAVTSSVESNEKSNDILEKEAELDRREKELAKKEEELAQRESLISKEDEQEEYQPELPEKLEENEPKKVFVFDENEISVGAESLSTLEMNCLDNPESKTNMRTLWLQDALKDVEVYVTNFQKLGDIEFDPFEGTANFTAISENKDVEEVVDAQDIELDGMNNMRDSIEPVTNVTQPIINEGVELNAKSEQLAEDILNAIVKIDSSMSYHDFSVAVARVLEDSYGSHNYVPFINCLKRQLDVGITDLIKQ